MSAASPTTKLVFAREFSEHDSANAADRGYLSHGLVEVEGRDLYPVVFYDPVRLQQDLEMSAKHGRPFVADPGMRVLMDVTIHSMREAVERLFQDGFFRHLAPVTRAQLAGWDQQSWPPGFSA